MDMLWVVSSSKEGYDLYALDTAVATVEFDFLGNVLPDPILHLPKSVFRENMTFQAVGSTLYMFGGERPRPTVTSSSSIMRHNLLSEVYSIDISSVDTLDLSKVTECTPLASPPNPLSIVCDDKLFVISSSLKPSDPSSSSTPVSLIQFLDPQKSDSWVPVDLPSSVVDHLSAVSAHFVGDDPYTIKAYGTRGHQIMLDLKMFTEQTEIKSLSLNTQTLSWTIVYVDPAGSHLPFRLPFFRRNLCVDSTWFASQPAKGGKVHFMQCNEMSNVYYQRLTSPVHCKDTELIEFGPRMVLALSCTKNKKILANFPCSAFLRVDFVRISDVQCNLTGSAVKKCHTVRAANFLDCSAETRLGEVVYFYSIPPPS